MDEQQDRTAELPGVDTHEILPVGETKRGRLLKPVEAIKIALMYHHERSKSLWEGLTGETFSNLPPVSTLTYLKVFSLNPDAADMQHISDSTYALLATIPITSTIIGKIWQNGRTLARLGSVLNEYKPLFDNSTLEPAERTNLEKKLEDHLHRYFNLELEGLPDHINPDDFDAELFLATIEKKLRRSIETTGEKLTTLDRETAKKIGRNLQKGIQATGNAVLNGARVFGNTAKHVAGYLVPTKGMAQLMMDGFENGYDAAHFLSNTKELSRHAWFAAKSGIKSLFNIISEDRDSLTAEVRAVEIAKGQAAIWTFWIQCNVLLQSAFITMEGKQGLNFLSSAFNNYSAGNTAQARADIGMSMMHMIVSAGFATKALQELFRSFSHNHDQLESRRAKKVDIQMQLQEEENALYKAREQLENLELKVHTLRSRAKANEHGQNHPGSEP